MAKKQRGPRAALEDLGRVRNVHQRAEGLCLSVILLIREHYTKGYHGAYKRCQETGELTAEDIRHHADIARILGNLETYVRPPAAETDAPQPNP